MGSVTVGMTEEITVKWFAHAVGPGHLSSNTEPLVTMSKSSLTLTYCGGLKIFYTHNVPCIKFILES